jgi:TRAP-type mannitol/chloroaromatic compound transport system permease small subunit
MAALRALARFIDALNDRVGRGTAWLTTGMVLLTAYDSIMRYGFQRGSIALQELEWHLFGIVFLLGAGYTLKEDAHVRVDILYTRFGPRKRAWVNLLGAAVALLPFCALVIWSTRNFVWNSWNIREFSPDPGGLPARYVLKAMIPVGFFLVALQGVSEAIKSLAVLTGKEPHRG